MSNKTGIDYFVDLDHRQTYLLAATNEGPDRASGVEIWLIEDHLGPVPDCLIGSDDQRLIYRGVTDETEVRREFYRMKRAHQPGRTPLHREEVRGRWRYLSSSPYPAR
ncbi:hypothetical protein [Modicisalibacter coralii]|uniref:hypothetical protein n=1 Tax=Modicisalibacter coralii TaxID=2304602 RepID=UPI00100BD7A2|nr:hypothetical protein [Halomonas coralii]